jgi:hypothetical protein
VRSLYRMLIGIATLVVPAALAAQKLTPGTWTGTITPPNEGAIEAAFDVRMSGDTTKITLKAGPLEAEASEIKVEANRLLFTFRPGENIVKCILLLHDDKSYSGDCLDDQGAKGVIVMKPPKA